MSNLRTIFDTVIGRYKCPNIYVSLIIYDLYSNAAGGMNFCHFYCGCLSSGVALKLGNKHSSFQRKYRKQKFKRNSICMKIYEKMIFTAVG